MPRRVITELFWHARCGCGWETVTKNDADTVGNKVKNHLMTYHRTVGAEIVISPYAERRLEGQLPATGEPVTAPVVPPPLPA